MSQIVKRIAQFIEATGLRVSNVESAIGVSNGTLGKAISNNKSIKTETLESFLKSYDRINPFWLLLGEGEMEVNDEFNLAAEPGAEYKKEEGLIKLLARELASEIETKKSEDRKKIDYIYNTLAKAEAINELEKVKAKIDQEKKPK